MLEESGETRWGQGSLLILFQVIPWIIKDLAVPKLREGRGAEPRSWGEGGRKWWQTEGEGGQPGEHRQLELRMKSNSRTAFVLENALDPNE